ncbi:uncharacterized hydrophobic domain-containing protein [Lentzea fradiae]|uniref:Uncharacterized hydrophobic domain-containing protein n=1 Tax=Lentzea fradiae TaxID=200378 RepID=A0A1G7UFN7_9PSEU|nr:DUF389 domain-containing protein [Lentzea fradiae]SDG46091.1 uncharacterized hydrophobic domain-containing protein [Lentzea fradiae]
MIRLRVVCPADRTEAALAVLRGHAGATHLVLLRGAAIDPEGDLVTADVAREAVDEVVGALCELGIDRAGGITIETIDTSLSDAADRAQEDAPGDGSDAIVWDELIAKTGEESRPSATFQAFLTIACLLAAVGIATNSTVTLVGAMVVGPEFGPLAAIAVGLVARRRDLVHRAAVALGLGFPLAIAVTAALTWLGARAGLLDRETLLHGTESEFIYQFGPFSLVVALLAGAAGMLSITSAKSAALVGVFISVMTVPAAGYAALAAVLGVWDRVGPAVAQLGINLIGIVAAASFVLVIRRRGAAEGVFTRPLSRG